MGISITNITRPGANLQVGQNQQIGSAPAGTNPLALHVEEYTGIVEGTIARESKIRQFIPIRSVRGTSTISAFQFGESTLQKLVPGQILDATVNQAAKVKLTVDTAIAARAHVPMLDEFQSSYDARLYIGQEHGKQFAKFYDNAFLIQLLKAAHITNMATYPAGWKPGTVKTFATAGLENDPAALEDYIGQVLLDMEEKDIDPINDGLVIVARPRVFSTLLKNDRMVDRNYITSDGTSSQSAQALATANTALDTASIALGQSAAAVADAADATVLANVASSDAATAVATANQAAAVADGIDTKAQAALDSAAAAVSTANGIDAKATQAQVDAANAVTTANAALTSVGGGDAAAIFDSPAFIGTPTAPTPATTDNSTKLATTAYVKTVTAQGYAPKTHSHTIANVTGLQAALNGKLNISGGTLTGTLTVNGFVYSKAKENSNPALFLRDVNGNNRGNVYWDRNTDRVLLSRYNAETFITESWARINANNTFQTSHAIHAPGFNGNATSATKLATSPTINGTSFNGTANITTTRWGAQRTLTIGAKGQAALPDR